MSGGPRACAVIPVFDHAATVGEVVAGASRLVDLVVVVDDGSRDGSVDAAEAARPRLAPGAALEVVRLPANAGKGAALLEGFRRARAAGRTHAIVLDADGQHRPSDLPAFLDALRADPAAIVVGARDLGGERVPRSSRTGRWVSNFWTLRLTGFDLPDTQSGYRLYPLEAVLALPLSCRRYDFEVEVLVRGAWAGLRLAAIPVDVHYPPREERVSHFRALADNVRISWTYTRLACRRLLPTRRHLREAREAPGVGARLREALAVVRAGVRGGTRPAELALAVGAGAFIGSTPAWGFHSVLSVHVALRWHLNAGAAFLGSNVSNPFMAPFLIFASVQCAHLAVHGRWLPVDPSAFTGATLAELGPLYLLGWPPVAAAVGVAAGLLTLAAAVVVRRGGVARNRG